MILQLVFILSLLPAHSEIPKKGQMFILTECSKCRKIHRECLDTGLAAQTDIQTDESKEQLTCDDTYVACFRANNCQSEH